MDADVLDLELAFIELHSLKAIQYGMDECRNRKGAAQITHGASH